MILHVLTFAGSQGSCLTFSDAFFGGCFKGYLLLGPKEAV